MASTGATVAAMLGITLVRLVAPLNTAPFLLYLPVMFVLSLALGWRPGMLGLLLSDLLAAFFFFRDDHQTMLRLGQVIALAEYLVVGAATVLVCDALRRAIIESETLLADLVQNRASLEDARQEAEEARNAAEGANRAKSAFLANMSHELRTPLSAVIGYSEMLEEEAEEAGQAVMLADLGKIESNAKHLLHLINDVLDLSKVEANKMEVIAETFDVASFLHDVAATMDALVRKKANTLEFDLGQDLGDASTDVTKLRQCLFNLIGNAAKFTEAGKIILGARREARPDGSWLMLTVTDTGIGMTPEQVSRLFQRFVQADETTTRKFGGTGLGLALSRAFARLLGGDIDVRSAAGEGTCFTVSIPASLPDRSPDLPAEQDGPAAVEDERELVVVIDDEAAQRELTTRFLRKHGFAVITASDGPSGLELVRARKPHVVLLDVMMPGMDGWAVLKTLKEDPATASIPVVMVSFVADPALGASLGADAAVPKPVVWTELKAVLDSFGGSAGEVLIVDDDADRRHAGRIGLLLPDLVDRQHAPGDRQRDRQLGQRHRQHCSAAPGQEAGERKAKVEQLLDRQRLQHVPARGQVVRAALVPVEVQPRRGQQGSPERLPGRVDHEIRHAGQVAQGQRRQKQEQARRDTCEAPDVERSPVDAAQRGQCRRARPAMREPESMKKTNTAS